MGAGQSTTSKTPSRALHVLRVTPSSPASETSIEPYFDFVVGFKDETLSSNDIDAAELERIVESHEGRPLDLLIWNSKNQNIRGKHTAKHRYFISNLRLQLFLSSLRGNGLFHILLRAQRNRNLTGNPHY